MKSKLLKRDLNPVWLGILVISNMFLMGQETWPPQTAVPQIDDIWHPIAKTGEAVTISGTNFGISQDISTVTFNGIDAGQATSWSDTTITINVPEGDATGAAVVTVNNQSSSGFPFELRVDECQVDADCDDRDATTEDACNNGQCEHAVDEAQESIDPLEDIMLFGGMYEAGGVQGRYERSGLFSGMVGAKCWTKAYSSMAPGQAKTMALGLGNEWASATNRANVEVGWWWNGSASNAPMLYMASYKYGKCVWKVYLDWFNPGANVYLRITKDQVTGTHKWYLYASAAGARKAYQYTVINSVAGSFAWGPDLAVWGERTSNVSNRGEFWKVYVYKPYAYGPEYAFWKTPNTLYDFAFWDSDPNYYMRPYKINGVWYGIDIRP